MERIRSLTLTGMPELVRTVDDAFAELNRMFSYSIAELFTSLVGMPFYSALPLEMYETGDKFVLRVELPGLEKEDIDIRVRKGCLTIEAEKTPGSEFAEARRRETTRTYGRIYKALTIPEYIDEEKIDASYRNGVLTINFPKKPEYRGRKVEIVS